MPQPEIFAEYTDKYGEKRVIHRKKGRTLQVMRQRSTITHDLTAAIGPMLGANIRRLRMARGLTLEEMVTQAGLVGIPKVRGWEIENAVRPHGVRLGTLYALAAVLDAGIGELLPSVAEVQEVTGARMEIEPQIKLTIKQKATR